MSVGREILIGSRELGQSGTVESGPAIATDGDELLVVYMSGRGSLYAARFDRHGALLTPEPIALALHTEAARPSRWQHPRVLGLGGHYYVFFHGSGRLHVLRLARDGSIVARTALDPSLSSYDFDVATDGKELVIAGSGDKIVRLGQDLEVIAAVDIARIDPYSSPSRSIAYGDGRFAIVTTDREQATSHFLVDGVLTAPMRLGEVNNQREGGPTRVAWTGSAFVAAWIECYDAQCLAVWTPLTGSGEAAGPLRVLDSVASSCCSRMSGVTLTAVDEDTVLIAWAGLDGTTTRGRRFRLSGEPFDEEPAALGGAPVALLRTSAGRFCIVDHTLRMAIADVPLPDPVPLEPAVLRLANEALRASAVSADAIAIARQTWRGVWQPRIAIGIFSRDFTPLRELVVPGETAALATDGREFYALAGGAFGGLWFYRLDAPEKRVQLHTSSGYTHDLHLLWTGSELAAFWREGSYNWAARFDRNGDRAGNDVLLFTDSIRDPELAWGNGGFLLAWFGGSLQRLDAAMHPAGAVEALPFQSVDTALTVDGETEVFAVTRNDGGPGVTVATRRAGKPFTFTKLPPKPGEYYLWDPAVVATRSGYVVGYNARGPFDSTYVGLVERGQPAGDVDLLARGTWNGCTLHELEPDVVLALYTRTAEELPYGGVSRVFARILEIGDGAARRRGVRR